MRIHKIEPGQVYRGVGKKSNVRIKVMATYNEFPGLYGDDQVSVATLTKSGRAVRKRMILFSQLHYSHFTREGNTRRIGYVLEK